MPKDPIQDYITKEQWNSIGWKNHHGIALAVSSMRSKKSCGIGEYLDLIYLIDFCKSIGFDTIQLLPINDTGSEPSPYSAQSVFALHPSYLSLWALPFLNEDDELQKSLESIRFCNSSYRVQYQAVLKNKDTFLRTYYERHFEKIEISPEFSEFLKKSPWVKGYAIYKVLKDKNEGKPWYDWSEYLQNPTNTTMASILSEFFHEANFYIMVQFLAFEQFSEVKRYAEKQGVFLKGDIPILVNRDSADVWENRSLFSLQYAAGAPPDMYSEDGQYWGFPLYQWDEHKKTNFAWWKSRLRTAEQLFHIYRIDHFVGFFRIWAIPLEHKARDGFYLPKDPKEWIPQGDEIVTTMCNSSKMLPIGEDLGAVPQEVRAWMAKVGIPGTKVMRWERNWNTDGLFIPPKDYPQLSMTTVSTHDSETLAQWWQNYPQESDLYAKEEKIPHPDVLDFTTRTYILKQAHHSNSLFHINLLQEYLALFDELSWPNADDDRINIPGLVLERNWTYRFKPFIEEIVSHDGLKKAMKELIIS